MSARTRKFFSYYRPYLGLFLTLMSCAFMVAGIALLFPLLVRYITKDILAGHLPDALSRIFLVGTAMLVLIALQTACGFFVDYRGHAMSAMGDYIALVGSSGVGKTTLCALVPRFYEVSEGKILLDEKISKTFACVL